MIVMPGQRFIQEKSTTVARPRSYQRPIHFTEQLHNVQATTKKDSESASETNND